MLNYFNVQKNLLYNLSPLLQAGESQVTKFLSNCHKISKPNTIASAIREQLGLIIVLRSDEILVTRAYAGADAQTSSNYVGQRLKTEVTNTKKYHSIEIHMGKVMLFC